MRESEILRGHGENHGRTQVKTGIVEDEEGRGALLPTHSKKGASAKQKQDHPVPEIRGKVPEAKEPGAQAEAHQSRGRARQLYFQFTGFGKDFLPALC